MDMISTAESDGNRRQRASAQRGSISFWRTAKSRDETMISARLTSLDYLTVTSYLNRFVLIPRIEQMRGFVERQTSTRRTKGLSCGAKSPFKHARHTE